MINDIKSVLKILLLFLPLPLFWALFDQQGSRWTFQATRMNGDVGFTEIKPDQMQLINPLLILVFIPLFDCAIYPMLATLGIKRPLQKLTAGGLLAGIAFLISGFVEIQLEKTYPMLPAAHESQMRIFNGIPCVFEMQNFSGTAEENKLEPFNVFKYSQIVGDNPKKLAVFSTNSHLCSSHNEHLNIQAGKANSFFITGLPSNYSIKSFDDSVDKSKSGNPYVRVLTNLNSVKEIKFIASNGEVAKSIEADFIDQFEIVPAVYSIFADDAKISSVDVQLGGVYTIVISSTSEGGVELKKHEITLPNTVHMLWLVPQYTIITCAEVMFSVTGLEFAYSQAPSSMKSLLQALWLLTVALGNVIVVIIAEAKFFESQSNEFFLFAVMMFIDMAIFALLAMKYKYVNTSESKRNEDDTENGIPIEENKKKTFTNNAFQDDL
jgi:solute carrier family 15 oligopeptide transporter 1